MKKTIIAFIAGQAMQLVLLGVGMTITYSTNLLAFCAILGIMATLMLLIGSVLANFVDTLYNITEEELAQTVRQ